MVTKANWDVEKFRRDNIQSSAEAGESARRRYRGQKYGENSTQTAMFPIIKGRNNWPFDTQLRWSVSSELMKKPWQSHEFRRLKRSGPHFHGPFSAREKKKRWKTPVFCCFLLYNDLLLPYHRVDREEVKHFCIVLFLG